MHLFRATSLILLISLAFLSHAHDEHHNHKKKQLEAHEHGFGQLNVVTEGEKLLAEFKIPAHDIVGFEHQPKTKEQKASVEKAVQALKSAGSNLSLS
ncbi:MAG: DUF2796 domain-containing protein, partial [Pseudomonadota bacterium]